MKYFLPFVYGFSTRAKTIVYKLSFFIVVFLPIFFISVYGNGDFFYTFPRLIIAFIALYSVYEIGYIFNDTLTVRFEKKPTYRLNQTERNKVERLSNLLISTRIIVVIVCAILLDYLGTEHLILFIAMLGLLDICYAAHNYFRNRINILTIFLVLLFKYTTVSVLFLKTEDYLIYLTTLILIVPVARTIEFAAKKEYNIKFLENFNYDSFRVWYYLILSVVFVVLTILDNRFIPALMLSVFFLVFRSSSIIILKTKDLGGKIMKIRKNDSQ
ncbi:hypothetical protein [Paenibacillus contaminans]|uniref:WbuO protein n=1 Tax=Paenibacillus contaminans TaxID=450362 RepID=A0A329M156_9BACL|nr:hypothetical protein [Paenibacillus contaminans]RAV13809.1 hypothetical protein DQG23_32515 [Paenibacillus contaminans]